MILCEKWKKKHGVFYNDSIITLDTETSHKLIQAKTKTQKELYIGWIHSWKMCIDGEIYKGTRPSEFCTFIRDLTAGFLPDQKIIIFVHNLPYDFQYLKDFLQYYFGDSAIMATQPRKPFKVSYEHIELRCSYKLSNRSLEMWSEEMNVEHKKAVGLYDYSAVYYQDTYTETEEQERYTDNDVLGQYECILATMKLHGKKHVADLPLTSTGFVREEIAKIYRKETRLEQWKNRQLIESRHTTNDIYNIIEILRHGGYTHGNFYKSGILQRGCIRHRDFKSHYPSQMLIHKYPTEYPKQITGIHWTAKTFKQWVNLNRDSMYFFVEIITDENGIDLKENLAFPTVSCSHLIKCGNAFNKQAVLDNGRVVTWSNQKLHIYFTDIDFFIFLKYYKCKYAVLNVYAGKKDFLPAYIQKAVKKFYHNKRYYKDMEKQAKKTGDIGKLYVAAVNLLKSKNELNGIFGVCYTNPVRDEYYLSAENAAWMIAPRPEPEQKIDDLTDPYKQGALFFWLWGLYVAAYGVCELHEYINLIGHENSIYCDTDSIFYLSTPEIEKRIEERNNRKQKNAYDKSAFIAYDGKPDIFDCFTDETEEITQFIFGHAKCYAYTEQEEETESLHVTIAGVSKRRLTGLDENRKPKYIYNHDELQNIENFKDGFTFRQCGGTIAKYFDGEPQIINIDGHETEIASCCIIQDTTKKIQVHMYE